MATQSPSSPTLDKNTFSGRSSLPTPPIESTQTDNLRTRMTSAADADSGYASTRLSSDPKEYTLPRRKLFGREVQVKVVERTIPHIVLCRFIDLQEELFSTALIDYVRTKGISSGPGLLSTKPRWLGTTENDAALWIVIQCDTVIAKHVRRYLRQPHVKREIKPPRSSGLPIFSVLIHERPPRQYGGDDQITVDREVDSIETPKTLCGTSIRATTQSGKKYATIGGVVEVSLNGKPEFFALTVAHFVNDLCSENSLPFATEASGDSLASAELVDELSCSSLNFEMPHPGMDELPDQGFAKLSSLHLPSTIAEKDPYDLTTIPEFRSSKRTWTPLGSVATWPPQELPQPNLDWSLISIEDDEALLPNTDVSNPGPQSSDCLRVFEGRPADLTKERPVFLLDARMKRRRGILQPTPSYIFLPPGRHMVETFTLKGHSLSQGDCGLWVVDELSYEVYGQIVAMDHFAEIYVVPLHQIQSQISSVFGGSAVILPGSTSVSTERQRRRTRKHQLAETKAFTQKHAARGLSCLIGDPSIFEHYAGHDSMQTMELPKPLDDMSTAVLSPAGLPQDTIHWLKTPPNRNSNQEDGSMKMLLISTLDQSSVKKSLSSAPVPVGMLARQHHDPERSQQKQFVLAILNGMSLPLASLASYIKGHTTFVCIPPDTTSGNDPGFAFYMSTVNLTIVWWYSPVLRHTAAVVFHQGSAGASFRDQFVRDLLGHQSYLTHPMLPGYIHTRTCLSITFDMLDDCNREAFNLELAAGMPTWDVGLRRIQSDNVSMDIGDKAHALFRKLTDIRFKLRTYQQQIKFMSRCNSGHRQSLNMGSCDLLQSDQFQTQLDVMSDYTVVHLYDADSVIERLQTVLSSICRATTYSDSRATLAIADINNEIAWQARRSNSAMRTIAFVTMLYLPGTFVASFFSSGIFHFSASSDPHQTVVSQPFAIFWALTATLTLLTGGTWLAYLRYWRAGDRKGRVREETREVQCVESQIAALRDLEQDVSQKYYSGRGARQRTPFSTLRDKFQVMSHRGARWSDSDA
ncbi:hypothetical protein LTR06_005606 [Exophiala xenobiotica]|nr:hypothetical protein LTR06_005606 [Exophiala xenobiotica]